MVMENEDIEDIPITQGEANAFFDQLFKRQHPDGKPMSQNELADELGVHQTTVSRNRRNRLAGEDVTSALFEVIAKILRDQQWEELRAQRLQEQLETERAAAAQRQADYEAQKERDRKQRKAKRQREREEALRRRVFEDRRAKVVEKLRPYWTYMIENDLLGGNDDPTTRGDAPGLLKGFEPADITYPTYDIATIALASDDLKFPCGQTALQLRRGISARQRLTGEYPDRVDESEAVPLILRPDAEFYYGDDYEDIVARQCMYVDNRALAMGSPPLTVSTDAARDFHKFVSLDERLRDRGYRFLDSCLDERDVESLLRKVNTRTILPITGTAMLKGLKWTFIAAIYIALIRFGLYLVPWVWAVANFLWDIGVAGVTAAVDWLDRMKWQIIGTVVLGIIFAGAWQWILPKESDHRRYNGENMVAWRAVIVVGLVLLITLSSLLFIYTVSQSDVK